MRQMMPPIMTMTRLIFDHLVFHFPSISRKTKKKESLQFSFKASSYKKGKHLEAVSQTPNRFGYACAVLLKREMLSIECGEMERARKKKDVNVVQLILY